ncbi:acyltransferase family protein [Aestuariibaculum suncheonense]|uniref:Acyltransferase n=1 Tax=Aestuariibaculum suncheonense TaxID=1028745 RepID=A0A8J6UI33_9FLAO|nr:acyltransferase [Aestuariibaculum suncheonense]MBD0836189.1 acyltransferase [Aestuariibaculum suncheonense]
MAKSDGAFLSYVHSFRGLAILIIVFGHAVAAAAIGAKGVFDESYPLVMISEVFYHDSTIYFAIISGLLFASVLKSKGFKRFYGSKFKYVLLPYFFLTLIFTLIKIKFKSHDGFLDNFGFYLSAALKNLIYGKANFVMWYIPVLLFLYLVTPVLNWLQYRNRFTKVLFLIIVLMPLVVSRVQMAHEYILKIETMLYFTGAYVFGMWLGAALDEKLTALKKYKYIVFSIAFLSTVGLFYLYVNKLDYLGKVSLKESLFYVQKLCFTVLILFFFKKYEHKQVRWLDLVARDSFAIYFLHGFILFTSLPLFKSMLQIEAIEPLNIISGTILLLFYSVSLSLFTVFISKKVFKQYSRYLVGA